MSKEIYLVYEKYEDSEAVADIYDTEQEANKHAEWISEEPTNLQSWVEVREIKSNFGNLENGSNDGSIDIGIDDEVLDLLGGKGIPDYEPSEAGGSNDS